MTASYLFALLLLSVVCSIGALKRVAIFGITGGVSQLLSRELLGSSRDVIVRGITRQDTGSLGAKFELLNDKRLTLLKADPRVQDERLRAAVAGCDAIVINIGTTAFPTAKWEDGKNNPKIACVETVANILNAIKSSKSKPGQVILLSSIGVERLTQFPFSLLNAYGVLDCKLQSERLLAEAAAEIGFSSIAVRPGRLVGEPFTNFDLAKLLGQKQSSSSKAIIVEREERVAGDTDRADVALVIARLLRAKPRARGSFSAFSVVNGPGAAPSADELDRLLSTV